jgi:signal transduction histidine kinase
MWERNKIILAGGVIIAVLAVNAIISYRSTWTLIDSGRILTHTYDVLNALAVVLSTLKDAETGQRGFLITGDEKYLEPYNEALSRIDGDMERLSTLVVNNPNQHQRVERIEQLRRERLDLLRRGIELRRQGAADAEADAYGLILSGRGKDLMDEIRRIVDESEAEERMMLTLRTAESEASGRSALVTFVVVNLLAISFAALAIFLNYRELEIRRHSQSALQEANAELENRVKNRTEQLTSVNTELERSNRELQDFAFVASHDLQEPLRKIQAFGDLLKTEFGKELGTEGRDFVERMQNASRRMNMLISDLLAFSRVTTKAQPFTPVDLTEVVGEVINDLETRIKQTGGTVEVGDLPTIDADPMQMRQLLQNLIANALKFHRPNDPPVVKLSGQHLTSPSIPADEQAENADGNGHQETPPEDLDGFYQITVADNGIGFEEKYLDRIFTPFQRLHVRSEYEGTGMGLAVCRKIVERHGGAITARSQPGVGSTFLITLPVSHSEEQANHDS